MQEPQPINYFELFGLPVTLQVDRKTLTPLFFERSRQFHPDYHAGADVEKQAEALEKSALLNRAYKTFQNPDETIKYVLQLKGLLEEEEKYQLAPEFLMEVMDINEGIMDLEFGEAEGGVESVLQRIDGLEKEIYEPVRTTVEGYRDGETGREELLAVKEYYYRKKYLDRIRLQLNGKP